MINISKISSTWGITDGWRVAPAGLDWIKEGHRIKPGNYCKLGYGCTLGDRCILGDKAKNSVDIGHADGYRKCIASVNGVAYIGAGCRWFTLAEAREHWQNHEQDRALTLCLLESAAAIAKHNGWAEG